MHQLALEGRQDLQAARRVTDLGGRLRRALHAEAAQVRTSPDALHLIRARTRRPRLRDRFRNLFHPLKEYR